MRIFDRGCGAILALLALGLLGTACLLTDGGGGQTSTPTPKPITASGTIGYITPDGNFALMNPDGTGQRVLTEDGGATFATWSRDGSIAAVEFGTGSSAKVRGIRPDGSVVFEADGSAPLWSPLGDRLAVTAATNIHVVDGTGRPLHVFEMGPLPSWAPDGSRLAFLKLGSDGKAVPVIGDFDAGEETPVSDDIAPADPVFPIAWHPGGEVIAYGDRLYELTTGTTRDIPGTAVYWSPDGRVLLVAGEWDETAGATLGMILDASLGFRQTIGLSIRPSTENVPPQLFIQRWTDWTPDGLHLFYLDPEPGRETQRLYNTVYPPSQDRNRNIAGERPDISPDGQHVAFMYKGSVWVEPLDASTLVAVAEGGFPAWQPGSQ